MTTSSVRLGFFKLNVSDMDAALAFYGDVFGFTITTTFDEPDFLEHILALPGQEQGPNLLLVRYKDGRDVAVGKGHGPIGLITDDVRGLFDKAVAAGAAPALPPFETQGITIAIMLAPDGHEIELVQPPAA